MGGRIQTGSGPASGGGAMAAAAAACCARRCWAWACSKSCAADGPPLPAHPPISPVSLIPVSAGSPPPYAYKAADNASARAGCTPPGPPPPAEEHTLAIDTDSATLRLRRRVNS